MVQVVQSAFPNTYTDWCNEQETWCTNTENTKQSIDPPPCRADEILPVFERLGAIFQGVEHKFRDPKTNDKQLKILLSDIKICWHTLEEDYNVRSLSKKNRYKRGKLMDDAIRFIANIERKLNHQ